jgi:SsrA-binding protein
MKVITVNRKAFHDYEILDKVEAGMSLTGSEVKSLREGRVSLKDAYVDIRRREAFLINAHISIYPNASYNNHEPERERKLLLNKMELRKWEQKIKTRGMSIVPLQIYATPKGLMKIEIALAKGKREYEKKQKIKEKDIRREMDRDLRYYRNKR